MKISIIIPVYNVQEYISECLNSIDSLDLDYEVIIVDDGSKDNSIEIIHEFANIFKGDIKIICKENGGLSSARNVGIQNATGDYLFFLDSDDYIDKNKFEMFVQNVVSDGVDIGFADCSLLINGAITSNNDTKYRKKIAKYNNPILNGIQYGELFFDKKHDFLNVEACFQLIKKKFLDDNNISFLLGIYHEDTLFTITCLLNANKVRYYDFPFYIYRMRASSIMHTRDPLVVNKKNSDKEIIALSLYEQKVLNNISSYFLDTFIMELLLASASHFKKKLASQKEILQNCNKLTLKARLKVAIFKILSIRYA